MRQYPFWLKSTVILFGLILLFVVLSYGKFILMPLAFSALFAMLLEPLATRIEKWKTGRVVAILLSMLSVVVVLGGILTLFSIQFVEFAEELPAVTQRLKEFSSQVLHFFENTMGIAPEQQMTYLQRGIDNLIDRSGSYLSSAVDATTNLFTVLTLMPIFIFFMMYYKEMYQTFLKKLVQRHARDSVDTMTGKIRNVTQKYLSGLLLVILILAFLNSVGLLIVGIDHAIFFGVFAAFMAIIPYVGIIIGSLPPLIYALLLTDSLINPLGVIIVFAAVQFLEGNFITPKIIGSQVSINPFIAIIALIIGGQLWGISGMILFVPLIGILRVVFEEIESLRPVGYLLGNTIDYDESKEAEGEQKVGF